MYSKPISSYRHLDHKIGPFITKIPFELKVPTLKVLIIGSH